jgi:DUF4097 and DUF4098 domain-containing protein YvlB
MNTPQMKKTMSLLFLAFLAVLSSCVFNVDRVTVQKSGQLSSNGLVRASVDMKNYSGNITVTGTLDSLVKATVTVDEMVTTGSSESAADNVSVSIAGSDSTASVNFSSSGDGDEWERLRIESMAFTCTSSLDVSAKTTSGNISESGVLGQLDLEATSGNVTADVVSGCDISVTSGNIEITLKPDSSFASATLKTTSGNIKVRVPAGFAADLDLKTTSGNINTPKHDNGKLNGGNSAAIISCTATSGNIKIEEY